MPESAAFPAIRVTLEPVWTSTCHIWRLNHTDLLISAIQKDILGHDPASQGVPPMRNARKPARALVLSTDKIEYWYPVHVRSPRAGAHSLCP